MITSLIATILGMVGGLLPDVLKEVRDSRNAAREIELLRVQAELQLEAAKANADSKLREVEAGMFAQEMASTREYLGKLWESQAKPTGIKWLDEFNGALRPTFVSLCMILFAIGAVPFMVSMLQEHAAGTINAIQMADAMRASIFGEGILGSIFYLLGYRSAPSLRKAAGV
jgi:hypothetical protein